MKLEELNYELPKEPIDEENWNLDEWRKKYPMDYFKALHILSKADNGVVATEVFKALYKIIRMQVSE